VKKEEMALTAPNIPHKRSLANASALERETFDQANETRGLTVGRKGERQKIRRQEKTEKLELTENCGKNLVRP